MDQIANLVLKTTTTSVWKLSVNTERAAMKLQWY